jgi:hypothetical protein
MEPSFEERVALLNASYFFREFTFSRNKFKPNPASEVELADAVVSLDDLRIIYQVKERNVPPGTTVEKEEKWFKSEVLGKATKQVRDTLVYLQKYSQIEVCNDRGHKFNLAAATVPHIHKLIVYKPHDLLPPSCASKKYHKSQTAGVIHLIRAVDYLGILKTFVTPVEVAEYLAYRENLANIWGTVLEEVPEQALVGHYLRNLPDRKPTTEFLKFVAELQRQDDGEWDISRIISLFPDRRTTPQSSATDYYSIVKELAKLNRLDMGVFKVRFALSMDNAKKDESVRPYRFVATTGCGFIFIPLTEKEIPKRDVILRSFTYLHKYDVHLERCIGLTFVSEQATGWCDVQWCRLECPWAEDEKTRSLIDENKPLREVKRTVVERYGLDKLMS